MTTACDITLFAPGLLGPQPQLRQLPRGEQADLICLETLLSRAACVASPVTDSLHGLMRLFGVSVETDMDPPVAALGARYDGLEATTGWWLRADPVWLQPDRDQLVLGAAGALQLTGDAAQQLASSLNEHFAADGLRLFTPHPHRWYLHQATAARILTTPLDDLWGQNIHACLPSGKDAAEWRRLLNETQMLLHDHPVNRQREIEGCAPVSSLWFWGGGYLPTAGEACWDRVYADEFLFQALADWQGIPCRSWPAQSPDLTGRCLIGTQQCLEPVRKRDLFAWQDCLGQLQTEVLAPLQSLLAQRQCRTLTLLPADGRAFRATPSGLRRFWRRRKPLVRWLAA
ncbi:MAG: hypothetical protein LJE73_02430 [Proteobacteria bacterium]|jgi:hypothetical protein|nr:hypothetical protein [Pseudomonadota bacterium]